MARKEVPQDTRRSLAQKLILRMLICCQVSEIEAGKALESAYIQYMHWTRQPPEAQSKQFKEETQINKDEEEVVKEGMRRMGHTYFEGSI